MKIEVQRNTLVRLVNSETDQMIQAYWTADPSEALKQFQYAMDHDISINIKNKSEDKEAVIDDVRINFGNDEYLTSIEVYVTVF